MSAVQSPFPNDPISRIEWRKTEALRQNFWNPNCVMNRELELLEFSLLSCGWTQPILINRDGLIIDGYHRAYLAENSKQLRQKYDGQVPCAIFDLDEPSAMMLTIRINRAKGTHVAARMHDIVRALIDEHSIDPQRIEQEIGAHKGEVDLLYQADVFKRKNTQSHEYSQAWAPRSE